jgi:hypothetical protein
MIAKVGEAEPPDRSHHGWKEFFQFEKSVDLL